MIVRQTIFWDVDADSVHGAQEVLDYNLDINWDFKTLSMVGNAVDFVDEKGKE